MKRTGFRRPERQREVCVLTTPARWVQSVPVGDEVRATPKPVPFRSAAWSRAVARLTCVRCGRGQGWSHEAQSQAAHRNEGKGGGTKVDDALQAALCPPCHAEIDQGKDMTREQRRAEMDRCIVLTVRDLARAGRLQVTED